MGEAFFGLHKERLTKNILVNTSNLKAGGGLQVADSFLSLLYLYTEHSFFVVLSEALFYLERHGRWFR